MELHIIDEELEDLDQSSQQQSASNVTPITVVGIGGGGNNAINRMIEHGLENVRFISMNTDQQVLDNSLAKERVALGQKLTGGLGAGANPEIGKKAAEEDIDLIKSLLNNSNMVFLTVGMGGGTGTGAAPIVASITKELGILTVAVVTKPFAFEGTQRQRVALDGIDKLRKQVDALIIIPNQNLLKTAEKGVSYKEAFLRADDILRQGVQGISDLITTVGDINTDFADVRTIMKEQGDALMGIGIGSGMNRAVDAATSAINNALLEDTSIEGAKGILVSIAGADNLALDEFEEIMNIVTGNAATDAHIIPGTVIDNQLGDSLKVTVIATGFGHDSSRGQQHVISEQQDTEVKKVLSTYINLDDWSRMTGQNEPKQSEFSFPGVNEAFVSDDELTIPAFIRHRKKKNDK